jgi:hypothetical protein
MYIYTHLPNQLSHMQEKIHSIVRIFPAHEQKIEYLFMSDANFRELCTDYILCASKILDMKSGLEESSSQIREYEELQRNLEQEMLNLIVKKKHSADRSEN